MPTTDQPPTPTKLPPFTLFGDTILDQGYRLCDKNADLSSDEQLEALDLGMTLGGSARIATYLAWLLATDLNDVDYAFRYESPSMPGTSSRRLPFGPCNTLQMGQVIVNWSHIQQKIRYYTPDALVHTLSVIEGYAPKPSSEAFVWTNYLFDLKPIGIVAISDYNKGAISPRSVQLLLQKNQNVSMVIYDGYQPEVLTTLAEIKKDRSWPLVIKGSRVQWQSKWRINMQSAFFDEIRRRMSDVDFTCILTDESAPIRVLGSFAGLAVNTIIELPDCVDSLPKLLTNGAGDFFTACCLLSWLQLPKHDELTVMQTLKTTLEQAAARVSALLRNRQLQQNPTIEPWNVQPAIPTQPAGESGEVPITPVQPQG